MRAFITAALCGLFLTPALHAQADDSEKPYKVRVVLDVEEHRLLTDVFKKQVGDQLRDGIQAALGDLARVDVVTEHKALAAIRAEGLERALDRFTERDEYLTHFVRLDFSGTFYRLRTRLYNGTTGTAGPAIRTDRTRDRDYVPRVGTLLIERDLGLLGTVISEPDPASLVRVSLKGGKLADLSRWFAKGEVLGLIRADAGSRQPWQCLVVTEPPKEGEGILVAKLYSRYVPGKLTGLRTELLGTRRGPVRLRLMQEAEKNSEGRETRAAGRLDPPVSLAFRRLGFEGEDGSQLRIDYVTKRDLDTGSKGEAGHFDKIAFVTVSAGDKQIAKMPVPIVDDRLQVVVVPRINEDDNAFAYKHESLGKRVMLAYTIQSDQFKEINALTAKPDERPKALERIKATLARTREDHDRLSAEREELDKLLEKVPPKLRAGLTLKGIDATLGRLKEGETELRKIVEKIAEIEKEENDPKRKEWLVKEQRGRLLEKEGDVGAALEIYDAVPEEFATETYKARVAKLKEDWKPKDEAHAEARALIYNNLPSMSNALLAEKHDDIKSALATCVKNGDPFAPRKLSAVLREHLKRIDKELEGLRPEVNMEDVKPAEVIKALLPKLLELGKAAEAAIK